MRRLDNFLNSISMYRLMLYYLLLLFGAAVIFSLFKILPFSSWDILTEGIYIVTVCYLVNQVLGYIFRIKPNFESQLITGLILTLIVGPLPLLSNVLFLTAVSAIAMSSKYLINVKRQHIFNPAAFAAVMAGVIFGKDASWWTGNLAMFPFIFLGGLIVVRKIQRNNLILSFLVPYFLIILITNPQNFSSFQNFWIFFKNAFLASPISFFSFVMLTEPLTAPPNKIFRTYYGIFTAIVFLFLQRFLSVPYVLELSLLIANATGRVTKFNAKHTLALRRKEQIAPSIWEFHFEPLRPFVFSAGQFLEWSLPHFPVDNRGTRRYFTIASSPTEKAILLAVKIPEKNSTFKTALKNLPPGESLYATSLEGDFTLPKNPQGSYVFIAGGIGITPFRSIVKYLLDINKKPNIMLFYLAHRPEELVFQDVFSKAEQKLNLKLVYVVTEGAPKNWHGEVGHITPEIIKKYVNDIPRSIYYASGPQPMVQEFEKMLKNMGVLASNIKKDYFPGYTTI